jgi:PAS domain S-box-containing protein
MERQRTFRDRLFAPGTGVSGELDVVRRRLVDRSLTILALMVVPSATVSAIRYVQHGWHAAYVVHWLIALSVVGTWFFRHRVPFWVRTVVFLGAFAVAGTVGIIAFGLSGLGLLFLAGFCILSSVVLGVRAGMIAVAVCTVTLALIGVGLMGGRLSFAFDPAVYLLSSTAWLTATSGFVLATVLTIFITAGLRSALRESLDLAVQRAHEVERINLELDAEMREHEHSETALQAATQQLVDSSARFRTITETALDSIFCKDRERRYTFINPAMEALLGMPAAEILGRTPEEIFDPDSASVIAEVDRPVLEGKPVSEIRPLNLTDGEHTFYTIQVPLRDEEGAVTGICGIVRDITELTQAQQRSLELQTRLERAERLEALGLLAGGVAHDLNNILNPMRALPDQLLSDLTEHARVSGDTVELPAEVLDRTMEALGVIGVAARW